MGHGEKKCSVDAHSSLLTSWKKNEEIREGKVFNTNVVRIVSNLFSEGKINP